MQREQALRKSLEGRREVIAEVLAALQRIGRHPPTALMVRPEDALQSVRSAIMLGAVLPEMRHEAEALAGELARTRQGPQRDRGRARTPGRATSPRWRRSTRASLALVEARQKQQADTRKSARRPNGSAPSQLARQADDLKDLIARLEQGLDRATLAARNAARPA